MCVRMSKGSFHPLLQSVLAVKQAGKITKFHLVFLGHVSFPSCTNQVPIARTPSATAKVGDVVVRRSTYFLHEHSDVAEGFTR